MCIRDRVYISLFSLVADLVSFFVRVRTRLVFFFNAVDVCVLYAHVIFDRFIWYLILKFVQLDLKRPFLYLLTFFFTCSFILRVSDPSINVFLIILTYILYFLCFLLFVLHRIPLNDIIIVLPFYS